MKDESGADASCGVSSESVENVSIGSGVAAESLRVSSGVCSGVSGLVSSIMVVVAVVWG